MQMSRWASSSFALVFKTKPLVGALAASLLIHPAAYAATFGHSRVVSAPGQALRIDVPVGQLSPDDLRSLSVAPAPAAAWSEAGLTPPVELSTLTAQLADGHAPGSKVIRLRSSQPFNKPVADVLLDIHTASGRQRYQVSLLTRTDAGIDLAAVASPEGAAPGSTTGASIRVKAGDTMFAIARRHAVRGVSDYQMMMALFRANPQAFIHDNVNLVKAGSLLVMPDMAALTAISDREARRLFMQHARAFARYRGSSAGAVPVVGQQGAAAAAGEVVRAAPSAQVPATEAAKRDLLRLSGRPAADAGAAGSAKGAAGVAGQGASGATVAGAQGAAGAGGERAAATPGSPAASGASATPGSPAAAGAPATPGSAHDADVRADDQLALRKGVADAEQRVSQLEDNVKNLNEALRAQGSVIGELVVEGAKGLSESIAQATGPADGAQQAAPGAAGQPAAAGNAAAGGSAPGTPGSSPAADTAAAGGAASSSAATAAHGGTSSTPGAAANGASSAAGVAPAAGALPGSGAAGGAAPQAGAAGSGGATPSAGAAAANGATSSTGAGAANRATQPAGQAGSGGTAPPSGAGAANGAAPSAGPGASSGAAGSPGAGERGSTPAAKGKAGGSADTISTKTEKTVSWFQEHMLGVITGLLALIVLVVAWLLRRANSARNEGRDDSSGLITEAMVREKLSQIDLDLDRNSPSGSTPGQR